VQITDTVTGETAELIVDAKVKAMGPEPKPESTPSPSGIDPQAVEVKPEGKAVRKGLAGAKDALKPKAKRTRKPKAKAEPKSQISTVTVVEVEAVEVHVKRVNEAANVLRTSHRKTVDAMLEVGRECQALVKAHGYLALQERCLDGTITVSESSAAALMKSYTELGSSDVSELALPGSMDALQSLARIEKELPGKVKQMVKDGRITEETSAAEARTLARDILPEKVRKPKTVAGITEQVPNKVKPRRNTEQVKKDSAVVTEWKMFIEELKGQKANLPENPGGFRKGIVAGLTGAIKGSELRLKQLIAHEKDLAKAEAAGRAKVAASDAKIKAKVAAALKAKAA
jgi:hypothetical protein